MFLLKEVQHCFDIETVGTSTLAGPGLVHHVPHISNSQWKFPFQVQASKITLYSESKLKCNFKTLTKSTLTNPN